MKNSKLVICSLTFLLGITFLWTPNAIADSPSMPAGVVVPFAGPTSNIPPGWLLCDGSIVSNLDFPGLFSAIGEAHGDGNDGPGGTLFNLPDYRGAFLRGVDQTAGRDPGAKDREAAAFGGNAGNLVGSVQGDATAEPITPFTTDSAGSHTHSINSAGQHSHTVSSILVPGGSSGDQNGSPRFASAATRGTSSAGNHSHSMNSAGVHSHSLSGGDAETRPVNAYVNWIIKVDIVGAENDNEDDD